MSTFRYEKPPTEEALTACLAEAGGAARLLAGGTDLLGQLRARALQPQLVVDLKGVPELQRLQARPEGLSVVAAVILNRILEEHALTARYRALRQAVADLASYTIRNRATLVGNVANASPCADSVPPLCVMEARVEIAGPAGTRETPVQQFIRGNREVELQRGELITRVIIPEPTPGTWSGYLKRKRVRGHDLALASVALLRDPERKRLHLSVGSCTPAPAVISLDDMFARPDAEEAARRAQAAIHPIDDVRASIEYRRDMVAAMTRRLLAEMAAAS
jgi:CO/xanthine dehydrogenase FAD-binding subunit